MTTLLATIFMISMVFATGAIEADNYFIGFGFFILGLLSGLGTLYFQNKENSKDTQLYYKEN